VEVGNINLPQKLQNQMFHTGKIIGKAYAQAGYRGYFDVDFMYGKAFLDLDGHAWELFFLDQSKMPATPQS
jgi:predicted lactoylglutathione lyase